MNYDVDDNDREINDKEYVYTYKFRLFLNKVGQHNEFNDQERCKRIDVFFLLKSPQARI